MKKPEDQNLAWFLFKMAFSVFGALMLFSICALINHKTTAEALEKFIDDNFKL